MMKKIFLCALVLCFLGVSVYAAEDRGSAAEAKALLKKGVSYMKANGTKEALAEFDNPKGPFVKKDLYIYSLDMNGKCVQHYANRSLEGKNFMLLKDSDGKPFIKNILDTAKSKGSGHIDYKWTHPKTKKIEQKSSFFEKVNDVVLICGFYK